MQRSFYRHYKGEVYFKICDAAREEDGEHLIVYRSLKGKTWVRPASEFNDTERFEFLGSVEV